MSARNMAAAALRVVLYVTVLCAGPSCGTENGTFSAKAADDLEPIPGYNIFRDSLLGDPRIPAIVRSYMLDGSTMVGLHDLFAEEDHWVTLPFADLDGNGIMDSVLIMPEMHIEESGGCIEGESFVFTDRRFGKLRSPEPGCNHVSNMFLLDDLDEDGIREIGIYTSSCASRYKALRVFGFSPDTTWHEHGSITFDIHCDDPPKEERIRKRGNGTFEMLRVECEGEEGQITAKRWEPYTMLPR